VIRFNFGGPIHISGMAEARAVKFCTLAGYIKSYQTNTKSPLKGITKCPLNGRGHSHAASLNFAK